MPEDKVVATLLPTETAVRYLAAVIEEVDWPRYKAWKLGALNKYQGLNQCKYSFDGIFGFHPPKKPFAEWQVYDVEKDTDNAYFVAVSWQTDSTVACVAYGGKQEGTAKRAYESLISLGLHKGGVLSRRVHHYLDN